MAESIDELQHMMLREIHIVNLKLNMKKTKLMFDNYKLDHVIREDDNVMECIHEYIYLIKTLRFNMSRS